MSEGSLSNPIINPLDTRNPMFCSRLTYRTKSRLWFCVLPYSSRLLLFGVSIPINIKGDSADFLPTNLRASLKLQNVNGVSGYIIKIFITHLTYIQELFLIIYNS